MIHLLENAFDKQGQGYGNNFNYLPSNSTKIRKIKPSEIDDKVPFILPISCGGLHLYLDVQDGGLVGKKTFLYYLDEKIIHYAQSLTEKLPDGLDVCFFTNSGSESNDLAIRIARSISNSKETIVLDSAYHGHLSSLIDLSPYKHNSKGGSGPPDFVHTVPLPDQFRGIYRGDNCSIDYINEVKK